MDVKKFYDTIGQDYQVMLDRMAGNERFLLQLLQKFLTDPTMNKLTDDLKKGDAAAIFEGAHCLKGLSGSLGLLPLYDKVDVLVELTRQGSLQGAKEAYWEVYTVYHEIIGLMNDE